MTSYFSPVLAQADQSLLDNQWLAVFVILGSATAFIHAIVALRRSFSAPQKEDQVAPVSAQPKETPKPAPVVDHTPSIEIFAAIAAAVAVTFEGKARITSIQPTPVTIDPGHLQWSAEGRRQIYSSHKVR